jgi:lipopolysaccharide biosynthesis glycosyltransferase
MIPIFVGYDPRESLNFAVLANSLTRLASQPISIIPINLESMDFYRETHTDGSTAFSYSRFLVPYMMEYNGWAIFMDCDMLARTDISKLWSLCDSRYAIMCVQHDYQTSSPIKFLGNANRNYNRKNWSSVMLINCAHERNSVLTPAMVEQQTGQYLHQFKWLDDKLIGSLPAEWNWLADEYGANKDAKLIHYTLGSPCFEEYRNVPMADQWLQELYDLQSNSTTVNKRSIS